MSEQGTDNEDSESNYSNWSGAGYEEYDPSQNPAETAVQPFELLKEHCAVDQPSQIFEISLGGDKLKTSEEQLIDATSIQCILEETPTSITYLKQPKTFKKQLIDATSIQCILEETPTSTTYMEQQITPEKQISNISYQYNYEDKGSSDHISNVRQGEITPKKIIKKAKTKDGRLTHNCFYCQKQVVRISAHLQVKHKNEEEVQAAMLAKNDTQRNAFLCRLRRKGDHKYNERLRGVVEAPSPITERAARLPHKKLTSLYYTCRICYQTIKKRSKYKHNTVCILRLQGRPATQKDLRSLELKTSIDNEQHLLWTDVLKNMKAGKGEKILRHTRLYKYALSQWSANTLESPEFLRKRLSDILLMESKLQKMYGKKIPLEDFVELDRSPTGQLIFEHLIQKILTIIKKECGYSKGLRGPAEFQKPTAASRISVSIEKYFEFLHIQFLKEGDKERGTTIQDFLILFKHDTGLHLKKPSNLAYAISRFNKPDDLPTSGDIKSFYNHLESATDLLMRNLKADTSNYTAWKELAENVASRMVTHNRRRVGEINRLKISMYRKGFSANRIANMTDEIKGTLDEVSSELLHTFKLVETIGKNNRKTFLLVEKKLTPAIELLISTRSDVGIPDWNENVFSTRGDVGTFHADKAIRSIREEVVNLKKPSTLTGTKMRKHISTATQALNLTENQQDSLAKHLSHDIRTHRKNYRLPEPITELTEINKLLLLGRTDGLTPNVGKRVQELQFPTMKRKIPPSATVTRPKSPSPNRDDEPESSNSANRDAESTTVEPLISEGSPLIPSARKKHMLSSPESNGTDNQVKPRKKKNQQKIIAERTEKTPPKRRGKRGEPWSEKSKKSVAATFRRHILTGTVPRVAETLLFKEVTTSSARLKSVSAIKNYVIRQFDNPDADKGFTDESE